MMFSPSGPWLLATLQHTNNRHPHPHPMVPPGMWQHAKPPKKHLAAPPSPSPRLEHTPSFYATPLPPHVIWPISYPASSCWHHSRQQKQCACTPSAGAAASHAHTPPPPHTLPRGLLTAAQQSRAAAPSASLGPHCSEPRHRQPPWAASCRGAVHGSAAGAGSPPALPAPPAG